MTSSWSTCRKKGWFTVTDLSYTRKPKPQKTEPEEIVVAILAIAIWVTLAILFGRAL